MVQQKKPSKPITAYSLYFEKQLHKLEISTHNLVNPWADKAR